MSRFSTKESVCFSCGFETRLETFKKVRKVSTPQYQIGCPLCKARSAFGCTEQKAWTNWNNLCELSDKVHELFVVYGKKRGNELCELLHMDPRTHE